MPNVKVWIHTLPKKQLVDLANQYKIDATGTIDDLRRRLKNYAESHPTEFTDKMNIPDEADRTPQTSPESVGVNEVAPNTSPSRLGETMNLVRKWGCRFSGRDPFAFLERVEELRCGYGLTHDQLLRCLPELITGEPLLWYRNNREFWNSWDEFVADFRLCYCPSRTQAALDREIRDRIQAPDEPFHAYVTAIQTLMRRHGGLTATQQLDRIYENMNPKYHMYLLRSEIKTLAQLVHRMTEYDRIESNKTKYQMQTAPKKTAPSSVNTATAENETALINPNYKRSECCWNCGQRGHQKTECKRPFRKFCSLCGKTGVLTRDCHPPGNGQVAGKGKE